MANVIIVSAHPSANSFTHKAVTAIQGEKEDSGHHVQIIDLYQEDVLPYFATEQTDSARHNAALIRYQEQITWADQLFFVYPCWWGDCPSIMRNWFDQVFSKGFAFADGRRGQDGLLTGKTCYIITTTGNSRLIYVLNGVKGAMRKIWRTTRIEFCGMEMGGFLMLGSMDSKSRDEKNALAKVVKLART